MAETYKDFREGVAQRAKDIYNKHSVRSVYHPVWHTALAFFEGEQWKVWNKFDKRLKDFEPAALQRRMVINRIEKIVTTFVAHYMKELPSFNVNPNSNTPDDVNAADLSESILRVEYSSKLEQVLEEYFYWKYIIGTGIRGLFWDATANADIRLPVFNETGEAVGGRIQSVPEVGQLYLKVINPFNFFPVGGAAIEDCTEILYVEAMPLDDIKDKFKVDAKEESIDIQLRSASYRRDYQEGHKETFEKRCKVFYYYRKKSAGFPNGLYAVIINDKSVIYRDNPYLAYKRNYPFFKSSAIPVPGQFFGKSPVEQLRRVQIAYNYVYSVLIQTLERMGKLKWWVPKGANVENCALDSKVGEIVYYTPNPASPSPTQANANPIPYYYFQVLEWLDKAFEDISGFHEVKNARLPTGANNPSGVMVNLLLEQDETRLAPAIKQYLASLKDESKLYLTMAQKLYSEARVLKIGGLDREAEIRDFMGSEIQGNNDVVVELAPLLSESRSSWEETVKWAVQAQLIDPKTALQKLKLEHPKTVVAALSDERLQLRENMEMRQGKEREVQEWENDEVHLHIVEQFLKSPTFEKLSDEIKQLFINHRDAHLQQQAEKFQQRIQAQMAQQAAMQPPMAPPGAGGGPPAPPMNPGMMPGMGM